MNPNHLGTATGSAGIPAGKVNRPRFLPSARLEGLCPGLTHFAPSRDYGVAQASRLPPLRDRARCSVRDVSPNGSNVTLAGTPGRDQPGPARSERDSLRPTHPDPRRKVPDPNFMSKNTPDDPATAGPPGSEPGAPSNPCPAAAGSTTNQPNQLALIYIPS